MWRTSHRLASSFSRKSESIWNRVPELPEKWKGGRVERFAEYWKGVFRDYKDAFVEVKEGAKAKPVKAALISSAFGTALYCNKVMVVSDNINLYLFI